MVPSTISRKDDQEGLSPRCYVSFSIADSPLDFKAISEALNQKSATTRKAGSRISQALQPLQEDVWSINSPLDPLKPLGEHLRWLHEQLQSHVDYLAALSRTGLLRVYIGFTLSQEQGSFRISPEFVHFFASVNALIDMYILCNFGDDPSD
jgi:hypothetical protein